MPDLSRLDVPDRRDGEAYVMSRKLELAVDIAYATGRPLLLRGDPGSGKSSLAAHIALMRGARYYEMVVTSRTQAQDLLWTFDSVRRLADAQLRNDVDDRNYVEPGVLWWAFARDSALELALGVEPEFDTNAERSPSHAVVLIDEIDKADPDLPNGLLVPLGSNRFRVTETGTVVEIDHAPSSSPDSRNLIVITTNEERELPQAFLRRCVVVWLDHPDADGLVAIARSHLDTYEGGMSKADEDLAFELAAAVVELRAEMAREAARPPSTAEFLDALRACRRLGITTNSPEWQELRDMALVKQQPN